MSYNIDTWLKLAAYTGGGLAIGLGSIGAAIGEGHTAAQANQAISRRPDLSGEVFKSMLVGQAIAESAAIFALVVSLVLLFTTPANATFATVWALLAAGLSIGLGAIGSGVGAGFPAAEACKGMVHQPSVSKRLTTNMLIGSAVCQTPSIFALVIAFILLYTDTTSSPVWPTWAALFGAGLSAGLSAIGAGFGSGLVAGASCEGIARQPRSAGTVTNSMLLGQAITQTTAIYGLLIAFILLFKPYQASEAIAPAMALIGAGLCMGLGAIGPGIGEGVTAQSAIKWIARNPTEVGVITRSMLVGMAVAESTGIYSMVIALILLFVV
ncbi:MAG: ATP synthase F0 subunit C [Desulfatitalea sp.]|nr:ATP synthase F0 subunit C [Desulfatitalea sp.]NNJ98820.1 ATP synthase F0 subunit C [Desulfatitalea sp.]